MRPTFDDELGGRAVCISAMRTYHGSKACQQASQDARMVAKKNLYEKEHVQDLGEENEKHACGTMSGDCEADCGK